MMESHWLPVAGLILAALGPVLGTGCGAFHHRAVKTEVSSHALAPGAALELASFNGSLRVRAGEGPAVRLERTVTCRSRSEEEAREGLALVVPLVEGDERALSIVHLDPRSHRHRFQVDLSAEVPTGTRLVLRTSNGPVEVDGVEGDVLARTANGRVVLRHCGREEVEARTSNGTIIAEGLRGVLRAHTSNGRIEVRGCPGAIDASTSNGKVEIDCSASAPPSLVASTSNGEVRCTLPGDFEGDVDARTSNGSIRCDFPVTADPHQGGRKRLKGRIGRGGPSISITTSNGKVEIRRAGDSAPAEGEGRHADSGATRKV